MANPGQNYTRRSGKEDWPIAWSPPQLGRKKKEEERPVAESSTLTHLKTKTSLRGAQSPARVTRVWSRQQPQCHERPSLGDSLQQAMNEEVEHART